MLSEGTYSYLIQVQRVKRIVSLMVRGTYLDPASAPFSISHQIAMAEKRIDNSR